MKYALFTEMALSRDPGQRPEFDQMLLGTMGAAAGLCWLLYS
ncbi:MAG TPA: hypothetical protein VGO18_38310 [Steroidobacteraceae bacterium]|nr:hypothetical protein [Steroidobacteraceae bacterium]